MTRHTGNGTFTPQFFPNIHPLSALSSDQPQKISTLTSPSYRLAHTHGSQLTTGTPQGIFNVYIPEHGDKEIPAVLILQPTASQDERINVAVVDIYKWRAEEGIYANVSELPKQGCKARSPTGPWEFHETYFDAKMIQQSVGQKCILKDVGDDKKQQVEVNVIVRKIDAAPTLNLAFTRQFMDRETAHIIIFLRSTWEHEHIHTYHVRAFFEEQEFIVFSCTRPSYKYGGASIGTNGLGGMIHANVRPRNPTIPLDRTQWPPFLSMRSGTPDNLKWVTMPYKITENQQMEGKVCLAERPCHRPFKPIGTLTLTCQCPKDDAAREQMEKQAAEERAKSAQP